jgi:hypothetical protein
MNGFVKGALGVPVVGEPELRGAAEAEVSGAGGEGVREGGAEFGGGRWEEEKARNGVEKGAGCVVGDVGEEGVESDDVDGVNSSGSSGGDGGEGGGVDLVEEGAVGGDGGEEWEVGGKGVGWGRVVGGGVGCRSGGEVGGGVGVGGVGGGGRERWSRGGRVVAGACMVGEGSRAGVKVGVLGVVIEEGDGVGDARVAEVVAAGKDANGGLVGDRVGGVVVSPLGGRWQVALGA